jgi:hypothetical protein
VRPLKNLLTAGAAVPFGPAERGKPAHQLKELPASRSTEFVTITAFPCREVDLVEERGDGRQLRSCRMDRGSNEFGFSKFGRVEPLFMPQCWPSVRIVSSTIVKPFD